MAAVLGVSCCALSWAVGNSTRRGRPCQLVAGVDDLSLILCELSHVYAAAWAWAWSHRGHGLRGRSEHGVERLRLPDAD